jgi:amino acid adenylation domain-containing protein
MNDLVRMISALSPRKRALLVARNPLSFAQQRLWLFDQMAPGSPAYNVASALHLAGSLDIPALRRTIHEIVRRHEVLRTTFLAPDGLPLQVVHPDLEIPVPVIDLQGLGEAERAAEMRRLLDTEARRPFDLAAGPLVCSSLLRLAAREHVFLATLHHVIADGWSVEVLTRELVALYSAFSAGRPSPLPELPIQYLDFTRWQREWLTGPVLDEQLAFWKTQLAGAPPTLDLPTDHPVPRVRSFRSGRRALLLPPALGDELRRLSQRGEATLFMTMLAAFMALLGRLTGQTDLVVGSPVANRTRAELEPMIGFFLNMLALRGQFTGDSCFLDLLGRVREAVLAAQSHQDLPFERLVEELQPERTLNRTPVFQTVFTWLIAGEQRLELPGLALSPLELEVGASQYDLTLSVLDAAGGLAAKLEYSSDLFEDVTIRRFLHYFEVLLSGVVEDSGRFLSELPLLASEERRQLLADWTTQDIGAPEVCLIHELFAQRAAVAKDLEAVAYGDERLTYAELDRRTDRLALHLQRQGVGPDTLVALYVERSLDLMVGLLGILKAGGAYLPLDPFLPRERRAWILADSGAAVVVTQESLARELPAHTRVICLDANGADAVFMQEDGPARPDLSRVHPDNLAYVSYTSGSTGRPKGVQITHRNVINFLRDMEARLRIGRGDTLLAVTTLAFDISVLELVLPLFVGARVALVGPEETADGMLLAESLARHGATLIQATPATFQLLLQSGWRGHRNLKILCGGEALPPELARELLQCGAELWNLYGPTETTIWSAAHPVTPRPGPVPIGLPIAATSFRVLGPSLELQPLNVLGELHIGGAGLARGYAQRPELTAERFIPDAWSQQAGARLYKTGDLVRIRPDGTIDFFGRIDHQVKLRGFRIELGEIEAVLREHAGVREAVVLLRQDHPGNPRLSAYVVAAGAAEPALAEALRSYLHERLPAYMLPSAIVVLDALPLTPNGKLDRQALPAPELGSAGASGEPVAPRTALEEQVARIWAEELGAQRVGVESSFFELGGHSLIAARMMHHLRRDLGIDLPLAQLFETPTVAGLATAIARRKVDLSTQGACFDHLPPLVPDPASRHEPFPLNEVQQAYWIGRGSLFALGNVASHNYMEIDIGDLDVERLTSALRRLVERHDMLRAIVLPDGRQQILPEVPPYEVRVLDLRRETLAAAAVALAAVREAMSHQVLPADRWPLFEVRVSLLDEQRARLHWSIDYLIADAWSMGIIFRDVFALYDDSKLALPPLTLSFRDCVMAEQRLAGSEPHRRAEEYWKGRLAELPPAPQLPLAKDPRLLEKPRFVRRSGRLEPADWSRLKARGARAGLTPSGVLLATYCEVLGAWSRSPRFTLNVTLFNRPPLHSEINEIVGDFTSLSLLTVDTALAVPFALRARAVQEQLWRDMEHQAVGAVQVLRELALARGASTDAMMPVVFTSVLGQYPGGGDRMDRSEQGTGQVYSISQTPQVWLDHQVTERGGALIFYWDAVEDIFPSGLLDDLFAAYGGLLETLIRTEDWGQVARTGLPEAQLATRQAVNSTTGPIPQERLQCLFSNRSAEQPDRPAVIAPERTLTYGELDRRSNQLAHRLREIGVAPNELVAVVMEKGWQQIVAALAIVKSGAAYLPIDPDLPRQRVHLLLERGQVRAALTQVWLEGELEWPPGLAPLCVEDEPSPELPDAPLASLQVPEDLAYVIYTSGSTGEPKGVMIDHRGAINTILDVNERFQVTADDRVLALSALGFDLSVYDIFGLLATGGCLVLPDPTGLRDPEHWAELIERHRVTLWNTVPALMEMLVTHESGRSSQRLSSLRLALLSGDWVPVSQADRLRRLAPGIEVVSLGGATEASIWSILYPIGELDPAWSSIPYGRPMRNQRFHVLDHALEPRPVWVPGELYIGGLGLARGYWRDAERTAARFIDHPHTGERLYRTGDLGRYLPDGTIEFLGREDFQVKIRGHRIELGEVEAALQQIEEVRSAVVAAVGDRDDRRLVAYVVLERPPMAPEPRAPEARERPREAYRTPPRIDDEIAQLEFKLSETGVRRFADGEPAINLFAPPADERFLAPFHQRRTHREFSPQPIAFADFSRVMAVIADWRTDSSLPGDVSVHIYIWVRSGQVDGVAGGTYAYDPVLHRLEPLAPATEIPPQTYDAVNRPVLACSAFAVFLSGRTNGTPAGADLMRQALMLRAGALGQALMEEGPAGGIGFCPIGNVDFASLRKGIGLDGSHLLLHSLLGGRIVDSPAPGAWTDAPASTGVDLRLLRSAERDPLREIERSCSRCDFLSRPASFQSFGTLLSCLRQWRLPEFPLPKYRYPSAGNLYPIQVYLEVHSGRVEGVAPGTYYYHPRDHRLVLVSAEAGTGRGLAAMNDREAFERSAFTLLLVGRLSAMNPIYGDSAYDFCLLEMGYMTRLLAASVAEQGLGLWLAAASGAGGTGERLGLEDDGGPVQALACGPVPDLFASAVARDPELEGDAAFTVMSTGLELFAEESLLDAGDDHVEITARLRSQLEEVLPGHMVPAQFFFLDTLPLSANGKVDRKSLPSPEEVGQEAATMAHVEPRSDFERRISQVWQEVLGREHISVNGNFFGMGGNSLHMVRVCARLGEELGREVRVTELFRNPTVAALARVLSEKDAPEVPPEVQSIAQKQKEALKQQRSAAQKRIKVHG